MDVWLDDERATPAGFDATACTAAEAIRLLETKRVRRISLDHDLGEPHNGSGYDVACWIEAKARAWSEGDAEEGLPPLVWSVHSQNPVGRANMIRALKNADRFWGEEEGGGNES